MNYGQTVYFFLTLPQSYLEYVTSQLTAAYPEVLIQPLQHNPLAAFSPTASALKMHQKLVELRLSRPDAFPLMTFEDIPESSGDALAPILSALAKLQEGETALIQLAVRKSRENWKQAAESYLRPDTSSSTASTPAQPKPADTFRGLIQKKLQQPSFQVRLSLVLQVADPTRLKQLEESLTQAFNVVQSPVNALHKKTPWLNRRRRLQHVLQRQVRLPKQYLSSAEVATLYHLPNKALSTIKNLAWGKALQGEPPSDLPIYATASEEERDGLNLFGQVEFKNKEQIFGLKKEDRRRHMYVMGKPVPVNRPSWPT